MAVLQKTRIKGLLTAEVGIDITGGVLNAPNADIDTITSNNITTSSLSSSNITLSNRLDASTANATFNLINSNTYEGLPEAVAGGVKGIVSITDSYTSLSSGLVPTTTALNYFRNDFQSEIIGNDNDPSTAETMKGLKNYVKENVITSGVVRVSSEDPAITPSINIGSGTITLNIPAWALQSSLNNVQKSLNDLSDLVDSLTGGQSTRLDDLEDVVYGTESVPGLQDFIPSTLYSQASTVLDLINKQINNLAITRIDNVETTLTNRLNNLDGKVTDNYNELKEDITNAEGSISALRGNFNSLDERVSTLVSEKNNLWNVVSSIPYSLVRKKVTIAPGAQPAGKIKIMLSSLLPDLDAATDFIIMAFLNGFFLDCPTMFPNSGTAVGRDVIFYRGSRAEDSYIETVNELIAGQEFTVIAFGYYRSTFNPPSTNQISTLSNEEINQIKTSSKLKW